MVQWQGILIASAAGILLVVLELVKSFHRNVGKALFSRWGGALAALNAAVAAVTYVTVCKLGPPDEPLWTAVIVGFTFPAVLRSRFTFYRQTEKRGARVTEFGLSLDEWYRALQEHCFTETNIALASERSDVADALARAYETEQLIEELRKTADAMPAKNGRDELLAKLAQIQRKSRNPLRLRHQLALLLMDHSPRPKIQRLLRAPRAAPADGAELATPLPRTVPPSTG